MSIAELREFADSKPRLVPLSVEQYHGMIRAGLLEEGAPIELLDGLLVRKDRSKAGENTMTVGYAHAWVITKLTRLALEVERRGCSLRIQQPITIPPDNEPEPDAVIAVGGPTTFRDRHPAPADITCVIEVADSSLRFDRTTKQRIYAAASLPVYLIVNLVDSVIERYTDPDPAAGKYRNVEQVRADQRLVLPCGQDRLIDIPAADLLR